MLVCRAGRADGTATFVGRHGTAVHPTRHQLDPGEALVAYTDGVTERRRGVEEFGQARVLDAVSGLGGSSAAAPWSSSVRSSDTDSGCPG